MCIYLPYYQQHNETVPPLPEGGRLMAAFDAQWNTGDTHPINTSINTHIPTTNAMIRSPSRSLPLFTYTLLEHIHPRRKYPLSTPSHTTSYSHVTCPDMLSHDLQCNLVAMILVDQTLKKSGNEVTISLSIFTVRKGSGRKEESTSPSQLYHHFI